MSRLNIEFPETDIVSVVFPFRNSSNRTMFDFDDNGIVKELQKRDLKEYFYRVPTGLLGKLKSGDMVVVNCTTGYQVAEIKCVNTYAPSNRKDLAYVVGKVDSECYFEFIENKKRLAIVREQLEAEKKRIESMVTYELLAERNPEFKALLDNFKALGGSID